MKKALVASIFTLLSLGCKTTPEKYELLVDNHAAQTVSSNYYLVQSEDPEKIPTIAILPAGYTDVYRYDSINFHDERWIENLKDSVKARFVKNDFNLYADSSEIDTSSEWSKYVRKWCNSILMRLTWNKVESTIKEKKLKRSQQLYDSLNNIYSDQNLYPILPSAIDSCINNDGLLYRNIGLHNKYEAWGSKAHYEEICDSLTKMVNEELSSKGLFKVIQPAISKKICDSIYHALDDNRYNIWYSLFYPDTTDFQWFYPFTKRYPSASDDLSEKQLSGDILQGLQADAYLILDYHYHNNSTFHISDNNKNPVAETRVQVFQKISLIGKGFNVLWSSELPIGRQAIWKSRIYSGKETPIFYPYEIIDYGVARENIKIALDRLIR